MLGDRTVACLIGGILILLGGTVIAGALREYREIYFAAAFALSASVLLSTVMLSRATRHHKTWSVMIIIFSFIEMIAAVAGAALIVDQIGMLSGAMLAAVVASLMGSMFAGCGAGLIVTPPHPPPVARVPPVGFSVRQSLPRLTTKQRKAIICLAAIAVLVLMPLFIMDYQETTHQRAIIDQVRPLIEACKSTNSTLKKLPPPSIRGKALVWDMIRNTRSAVHSSLPSELRGSSSDKHLTIFAIVAVRNVFVGFYSISGQPAYRQYVDICVIYWPEVRMAAFHSLVSKEPPSQRPVIQQPGYGDIVEPIAKWIASLQRED